MLSIGFYVADVAVGICFAAVCCATVGGKVTEVWVGICAVAVCCTAYTEYVIM